MSVLRDFHVLANPRFRCRGKVSGLEGGRSPNSVPCFLFHAQGSGDPATLPKAGVTTTISTQKEKEREKEHEVDF
jgi:hypothetical protein